MTRFGLLVVLVIASTAGADPTLRTCVRACKSEARSCLAVARGHAQTVRGTCTPADRRTCRRNAHRVLGAARKACTRLRSDCRACCRAGGSGPKCPVGTTLPFEPPPPQDPTTLDLPALPNGHLLVLAIPGAQLELDPTLRTPVTALGACTRWIASCVDATRRLDDCARSAPPCATDEPWNEATPCCPATCFDAYQTARRAGAEPIAAARQTYFADASCFPGVAAARGRGAP